MFDDEPDADDDEAAWDDGDEAEDLDDEDEYDDEEDDAPDCPDCGSEMVRRTARTGRNAGNDFWGCSDYPECRGTRDIASATENGESAYDADEYDVDDDTPDCPDCGSGMVRRTAQKGPNAGNDFWGCSDYPECRGTREIASAPEDEKSAYDADEENEYDVDDDLPF